MSHFTVADTTGGHLVSINSKDEETTVKNLFQSEYGGSTAFWMGGVRQGNQGNQSNQGNQGNKGNQGNQGNQGYLGIQGRQGNQGNLGN